KRRGGLEPHREKLLAGMLKNGFSRDYGERPVRAAWKRRGGLEPHREKLLAGMLKNGFSRDYGERPVRA
ncbi:hypothetical protein C7E25_25385, partial [Stenotrophomonas maltophilia]